MLIVPDLPVGKTMFIDSLLEDFPAAPSPWARDTTVDTFKLMPHAFCAELVLHDADARVPVHFLVQVRWHSHWNQHLAWH